MITGWPKMREQWVTFRRSKLKVVVAKLVEGEVWGVGAKD